MPAKPWAAIDSVLADERAAAAIDVLWDRDGGRWIADADEAPAGHTADRILGCYRSPVDGEGVAIEVRVSIGVVVLPDPAQLSVAVLMARADRAMCEAKHNGGARVSISR